MVRYAFSIFDLDREWSKNLKKHKFNDDCLCFVLNFVHITIKLRFGKYYDMSLILKSQILLFYSN